MVDEKRKVLMVAYHYPPVKVSSGVQRTLSFSRDLLAHDWSPLVLSVNARAYESTSAGQMGDIPNEVPVTRAWGLDTARHLALAGRYWDMMALPDRWSSWCLGGVVAGLAMIRRHKPQVLFSTYPIATAHLIALVLHKVTGLPWIADFRDSMTEEGYPRDRRRRAVFVWLEQQVIKHCSRAIFTTPGAVEMYRQRYPQAPDNKWVLIPNGYNESIFRELEDSLSTESTSVNQPLPDSTTSDTKPITLLHSGVLYPSERDPRAFFSAVTRLKKKGAITADKVQIILRASGHDNLYQGMLEEAGIDDIISLQPSIGYREALIEMLDASGLMIFQSSNCNHQIPAKIYEYFRCRKPIFALTDRSGDTAATMLEANISSIVPLDDSALIEAGLLSFIDSLQHNSAAVASESTIKKYSRQFGAETLASMLDDVASVGVESSTVHSDRS
jgi:Glycosyl transferase 4-like domain